MSTEFKHSEACLKARNQERADREAFLKLFPKACQACDAAGFQSWQESRGEFWGTPCSEWLDGECESCLEQGKCPRCGELGFPINFDDLDFSELKCSACGWTERATGIPEVVDDLNCGCLEKLIDERTEILGVVNLFQSF